MKAVILAGGFGSRLSEETVFRPKPMIEIGGKPILWHIMNIYASQGVEEFVIALGYKAEVVKEYFLNFFALNNDISVDLSTGRTTIHDGRQPRWKVHLVDTGLTTETGGRLKRLAPWLADDETFFFTYGDCVADIDLTALLGFHQTHRKLVTMTTVMPPGRFGRVSFAGDAIVDFNEKPQGDQGWINGGYFVLNRPVLSYIAGDETVWERAALERLVGDGQIFGYKHNGFWSCMDTLKEKNILESLWSSGQAPWKVWE
jgi:glucose-1-phosphate cytidylyltransferase